MSCSHEWIEDTRPTEPARGPGHPAGAAPAEGQPIQVCRHCGAERTASTSSPTDPMQRPDHAGDGAPSDVDSLLARDPVQGDDTPASEPPAEDGPRPFAAIREDLRQAIKPRHLETKPDGRGGELTFCPWHRAIRYLDHYTRGWWSKDVTITTTGERIFVTVAITIEASDGTVRRSATGTERLFKRDGGTRAPIPYGDPSSNAESQALRRALANFGLGLDLYEG